MPVTISGDTGVSAVQNGSVDLTTDVTGVLPNANGGLPSAGTSGNVLTSNGTTWTSAALPAGGVTSLNGQTGAITNTSLNAIGSYYINYGGYLGDTCAGSSITKANSGGSVVSAGLSGTWRYMGPSEWGSNVTRILYVRVS